MATPLTLEEAAHHLRTSRRWLLTWLRDHPRDKAGEPYFTPVGRAKLFHQADIARIERDLREGIKCRSDLGPRAPARRRTMKSAAPIADPKEHSLLRRAAELTGDRTLLSSSATSRTASTSTDAGPRRPRLVLIPSNRPS